MINFYLKISFFLITFFLHSNAFALNIATLNLQFIFTNSQSYNVFLNELNIYKQKQEKIIKDRESILINQKEELESLKLIANETEVLLKTDEYNKSLKKLMEFIDGINTNISTNIENNEKIINNLIIDISKNISENNEIDLILTEGQYFISSSSIDISNEILISLDKRNIKLNFNINN